MSTDAQPLIRLEDIKKVFHTAEVETHALSNVRLVILRMLKIIKKGKQLPAFASALVVLAMWGNVMAGATCSPMCGGRDCCLPDQSQFHSKKAAHHACAGLDQQRVHRREISDMDMVSSMDVVPRSSNLSEPSAIARPIERCSLCLIHSRLKEGFPARGLAVKTSNQIIIADLSVKPLNGVRLPHTGLVLRDHGPPRSTDLLYVLVSAFRI